MSNSVSQVFRGNRTHEITGKETTLGRLFSWRVNCETFTEEEKCLGV